MNKYYSLSPSSKPQINSLLSPIFEAVRKNKIHSYHQLQNHHQIQESPQTKQTNKINFIFEKKPKTANTKIVSDIFDKSIKLGNQTMYAKVAYKLSEQNTFKQWSQQKKNMKKTQKEINNFQLRGKSSGNSPSRTLYNKMFRVNSKIKKHLVEYIDFEEIEKMFYKKRDMMTRYQYFLKLKNQSREKEGHQKFNHHRRTRSKQIYIDSSEFHDQKNEHVPEYSPTMESFRSNGNNLSLRTPQKKKFWGRQNHPKKLIIIDNMENVVSGKTIEA